jgi:hypothetical protein
MNTKKKGSDTICPFQYFYNKKNAEITRCCEKSFEGLLFPFVSTSFWEVTLSDGYLSEPLFKI